MQVRFPSHQKALGLGLGRGLGLGLGLRVSACQPSVRGWLMHRRDICSCHHWPTLPQPLLPSMTDYAQSMPDRFPNRTCPILSIFLNWTESRGQCCWVREHLPIGPIPPWHSRLRCRRQVGRARRRIDEPRSSPSWPCVSFRAFDAWKCCTTTVQTLFARPGCHHHVNVSIKNLITDIEPSMILAQIHQTELA